VEGAVVVGRLADALPSMSSMLADLVNAESPSADQDATNACARVLERQVRDVLSADAEWLERDGRAHLRWHFGGPTRVLLLGHLDTVWPVGTLERWPFRVEGQTATGPGCFDMKAGLVQGLWALAQLRDLAGVTLLVTTDEEVGSPTSRGLVEESAREARAVLVLEPSAEGALKIARKGISHYRVQVTGRAAHAGLEPWKGANAGLELAHQLLAIEQLGRADAGTTVTPTTLTAGTTANTVPASAEAFVDVRVVDAAEQVRVDTDIRRLAPRLPGTSVAISGGLNRPPMQRAATTQLFALAEAAAARAGLPALHGVEVGGGSDGNFTAGLGVPTLDGLGAVGAGAHAEGEHVLLDAMPSRAALVALLTEQLLGDPVA